MAEDLMHYDRLAQDALRGVIRRALKVARDEGLPGEHHFYISFRTRAPGVEISERLRSQYPDEMTIVLQHQFWNLDVREDGFSVDLTFNKIPEKLVIPYSAVQGFFDPSVQFGLQFEVDEAKAPEAAPAPAPGSATVTAIGEASAAESGAVVSLDAFRKK
ncbi:MAG: ClpXP protease specificity-enhancing factor SspB [Parvibaculum sp.]